MCQDGVSSHLNGLNADISIFEFNNSVFLNYESSLFLGNRLEGNNFLNKKSTILQFITPTKASTL